MYMILFLQRYVKYFIGFFFKRERISIWCHLQDITSIRTCVHMCPDAFPARFLVPVPLTSLINLDYEFIEAFIHKNGDNSLQPKPKPASLQRPPNVRKMLIKNWEWHGEPARWSTNPTIQPTNPTNNPTSHKRHYLFAVSSKFRKWKWILFANYLNK